MQNIEQLRKLLEEFDLSDPARQRLAEVFTKIESQGAIKQEDKQTLLEIFDAEMFLTTLTVDAIDANIEAVSKALAMSKEIETTEEA